MRSLLARLDDRLLEPRPHGVGVGVWPPRTIAQDVRIVALGVEA
ncbi:MAG TPA: hypothetical protein VGB13_05405 [Candidatus Krumholzibacteria bacterium]